jgi:hypothetical protein
MEELAKPLLRRRRKAFRCAGSEGKRNALKHVNVRRDFHTMPLSENVTVL